MENIMDIKELKKLIAEEVQRTKSKTTLKEQETTRNIPSSQDPSLIVLKTLMSMPAGQIYEKYKVQGLDGVINSIKYMQNISKQLENTKPLNVLEPSSEQQFLKIISDPQTRNSIIQLMDDLAVKDEYQIVIEDFIDDLAATASTIVPPKKSLPQTNIGRLKTNK